MKQLIFYHFKSFFQHIFFSLDQQVIAPQANAVFVYITITILQNHSPITLLDFDVIHAMQLFVKIDVKKFAKKTILFYVKKQTDQFCKTMHVTIHADAHAHIVYQFALYQLTNLTKAVIAKPNGNQATIEIVGKYLMEERSSLQCNTYQYHELPYAKSSVIIEGVSVNQSSVIHKGFIFIAPNATRTDAKQSSRHITVTKNTFVHAEPVLDVQNNMVSCAHASAIGTVSKEAIFYLNSRGINKQNATFFLVQSFALLKPINQHDHLLRAEARQLLQSALQQ